MAPNLLSSTPAPFRPIPPRIAENRGGGAHVGHNRNLVPVETVDKRRVLSVDYLERAL
jgi:hypothetical protein